MNCDIEWGFEGLATCLWLWASRVEGVDDLDTGEGASIAVDEQLAAAVLVASIDRAVDDPLPPAAGTQFERRALPDDEVIALEVETERRKPNARAWTAVVAERYGVSKDTIERAVNRVRPDAASKRRDGRKQVGAGSACDGATVTTLPWRAPSR